ncbi:hypothetical protein [Rhodococcus sp. OK302]|uniref:hypothetical protein n=1 Tax=Rhodococcus sp. OK302 TaxID=1882769 RepID=UPI0020CD7237|nr:hypothetical protein [Rhodococcus sp. OK302]
MPATLETGDPSPHRRLAQVDQFGYFCAASASVLGEVGSDPCVGFSGGRCSGVLAGCQDTDFTRALPFLGTLAPSEVAGSRRAAGVTDEFPLHTGVESFEPNGLRFQMGGSTDVGDVSWIVPTIQCGVAVAAIETGMHSWQLVAQGKLPAAHKGMLHAAKIMACTAIDMIVNKNVLDDATVEFQTQTAKTPSDHPIPEGIVAPPLREALKV